MADEQTPQTPQDPNLNPDAPPEQPVSDPQAPLAPDSPQPAPAPQDSPPSGTTPESIPPADQPEGFGPNPPADPALAQREAELRQQGVENPASQADLPDPSKPESELPVGVVVGGNPTAEQAPNDGTEPGSTELDPAKLTDQPGPGTVRVQPVRVDGRNRRDDGDALEGHFVKVRNADHDGQIAAFVSTVEHSQETGYPTKALVRFKDTSYKAEYAVVPYEDLEPTPNYRGG